MQTYKHQFIARAIEYQALKFGDFTLKSGRKSPYFFNIGVFSTGVKLEKLGQAYAAAIEEAKISYDMAFGPAYKGIPLVTSTAIALAQVYHKDVPYAFNRKEPKDHGEGGDVVGAPLAGKVLIIDDVITAGTAIRQSIELITAYQAQFAGLVVAFDRQERGLNSKLSAIQELEHHYKVPVVSIIKFADLLEFLESEKSYKTVLAEMKAYREEYGVLSF